ncbi:unnamed protein product, partial [Brassica rapa subsp. trilocularis]
IKKKRFNNQLVQVLLIFCSQGVQNDGSESVRAAVKSKKQEVMKISSKPLTVDKRKTKFFEDAEKCN